MAATDHALPRVLDAINFARTFLAWVEGPTSDLPGLHTPQGLAFQGKGTGTGGNG